MKYKYLYESQARDVAIKEINHGFWFSFSALAMIVIFLLLFEIKSIFSIYQIFFIMVLIYGILVFSSGLIRMVSGEKWKIYLTNKKLVWETPNFQFKGFSIKLSKIDHILVEKHISHYYGKPEIEYNYLIVESNGGKILLDDSSGIDLRKLFKKLEKNGCNKKYIEIVS